MSPTKMQHNFVDASREYAVSCDLVKGWCRKFECSRIFCETEQADGYGVNATILMRKVCWKMIVQYLRHYCCKDVWDGVKESILWFSYYRTCKKEIFEILSKYIKLF